MAGEKFLRDLYDEKKIKDHIFRLSAIEEAKYPEKLDLTNEEIEKIISQLRKEYDKKSKTIIQ